MARTPIETISVERIEERLDGNQEKLLIRNPRKTWRLCALATYGPLVACQGRASAPPSHGRILRVPPRSAASGRPLRSWEAPSTRSLERLRYGVRAFRRAGPGGFPAARWRY